MKLMMSSDKAIMMATVSICCVVLILFKPYTAMVIDIIVLTIALSIFAAQAIRRKQVTGSYFSDHSKP